MSSATALFACSSCYSRHPFEELSAGQQLCKNCREVFPVVKCTYCRSEFQQTSKNSTTTICKKCEHNVKKYGKPSACDYCNILAAFIGQKCQRCENSEKKYGPPVTCEQCKQKCAFDRKDEDKKVDGKLLCWLCTLSFKRALAKTKSTDPARHSHVKLGSSNKSKEPKKPHDKRPQRVDVTKLSEDEKPPPPKQPRVPGPRVQGVVHNDLTMRSDRMELLKEEKIANLERQIAQNNKDLLAKDRMITELKAANFTTENEYRNKLKQSQRDFDTKTQALQNKLKQLQKEVAFLSKGKNKSSLTIVSRSSQEQNSSSQSSTPPVKSSKEDSSSDDSS